MYLELDGKGPYYSQITRALKAALLGGRLGTGMRLPPSRMLARELGVSRNTVVSAYDQLRAEGYLEGRVGSGSYVVSLREPIRKPNGRPPDTVIAPPSRFAKRARAMAGARFEPASPYGTLRYNLQYGAPYTNPTLTTAWSRELAHAAKHTTPDYAPSQGWLPLREALCDYLARRRGVEATPDDVLIVTGSQQALALAARVLVDEGESVVLEDPSYFGARQVLNAHGARIVPVPVDDEGLVVEKLPDAPPKFVFVTPSHQFPIGVTMSLSRRLDLIRYAAEQGTYIVEDDYDAEFRYDARPLAALRSLDTAERVIYTGTFSKVMFPALRLGYIVLPPALRTDFLAAKWLSDLSCPTIEQAALASFMANGGFERHIRSATRTLKERRAVLMKGLAEAGRGRIEVTGANAGMHLTAWLRDFTPTQTANLVVRARERGVGVYQLLPQYIEAPPRPGLLMGYAATPSSEIAAAMRIFGQVIDAFL